MHHPKMAHGGPNYPITPAHTGGYSELQQMATHHTQQHSLSDAMTLHPNISPQYPLYDGNRLHLRETTSNFPSGGLPTTHHSNQDNYDNFSFKTHPHHPTTQLPFNFPGVGSYTPGFYQGQQVPLQAYQQAPQMYESSTQYDPQCDSQR